MDRPKRSWERAAFGGLVALLLAPFVAQGLWRPLVYALGPSGSAGPITCAALAITAALVLVQEARRGQAPVVSVALGGLLAGGASVGFSLGWPGFLALFTVAAVTAFLAPRLGGGLPATLDGLVARNRVLAALYALLALFAVVSTARVSIFIGDPTRVDQQAVPGEAFLETHSCLTAYVHAATLSHRRVDNLYDERHWHGSHGLAPADAGAANPYRPFLLDYYAYPPPFLLAMAPLAPFEGEFLAQRALWFGLNGLLLALGLWIVARWIDGPAAHRVLVLVPIFLGSLPVIATLQIGNFQIAVVVISVLAMVAFDRGRPAIGGALLAFAILSKISPGVLGLILLVQRRWRAAAFAAGFGLLFLALSLLTIGAGPLGSFLTYALPRIGSGQAFAFLDDTPFNILTNMSPFGLPFKLQLLGLHVEDPWTVGRWISHSYAALLVVVTVVAGRRAGSERSTAALTWISLLVLAAVQSPFAPAYAFIGLLWAITLLAPEVRSVGGGVALVVLWLTLIVVPPTKDVFVRAAISLLQSAVVVGLPLWLVLRTRTRVGRAPMRLG